METTMTNSSGEKSPAKTREKQTQFESSGPIAMAIDPTEVDIDRQRDLIRSLRLLNDKMQTHIMPIGILALQDLVYPLEVIAPIKHQVIEVVNKSIGVEVDKIIPNSSLPAKILLQPLGSNRDRVATLVNLSIENNCPLIAVNTHEHRKIGWFRLGGFTQDLISISPIPVYVVGPKNKISNSVKTIVYPTDLEPDSQSAFVKAIAYAKQFNARLVIYHRYERPFYFGAAPDYISSVDPALLQQTWEELQSEKHEIIQNWCDEAQVSGVDCEFEFTETDKNICNGVNRMLEEYSADLIVMENGRKPFEGSAGLLRDVVSVSKAPVIIVRNDKNAFWPQPVTVNRVHAN